VLIYVGIVEAAAVAVIAGTAHVVPITGRSMALFGLLIAGMLVHEECSRGIERIREVVREGSPHVHPQSIWFFAAVLLLPPPLIASCIVISYAYLWIRVYSHQRPPLCRKVFSAATVVLACAAARTVLALVVNHKTAEPITVLLGPVGLAAVVGAGVLYWLINYALVVAVIIMTNPDQPAKKSLGNAAEQLVIGASVGLGVAVALIATVRPWLLPVLIMTVLAMHLGLLVPQYRTAARTDSKTGLADSGFWAEIARAKLTRAQATGATIGILLVDLDHFKQINDLYGHLAGDEVLRAVARAMKQTVRKDDLLGRWGGEEFVVLIPGSTVASVRDTAERLRLAITEVAVTTRATAGVIVTIDHLTASVGAAVSPTTATELDQLLLAVDTALYQAKKDGRDRVRLADAIGPR
jgi:diguanylate cyclase (GGDEF)-like protein